MERLIEVRWAISFNGRSWNSLKDGREFTNIIPRLDGKGVSSLIYISVPDDFDPAIHDVGEEAEEYLQCAGSAERLTIEIRRREGENYAQYVLGRAHVVTDGLNEEIGWGDHRLWVNSSEVFDASEAIAVFEYYRASGGSVPDDLHLRQLRLGEP